MLTCPIYVIYRHDLSCCRHAPPACSPPPPPPEVLRRPVVHYDGAALAQANFPQAPQKKDNRRRCNWK